MHCANNCIWHLKVFSFFYLFYKFLSGSPRRREKKTRSQIIHSKATNGKKNQRKMLLKSNTDKRIHTEREREREREKVMERIHEKPPTSRSTKHNKTMPGVGFFLYT